MLINSLKQLFNSYYFLIFIFIIFIFVQFFIFGYLTFVLVKKKVFRDRKRKFSNFIAHSHILIYLNNNVKNLHHFLGYLNEEDLNYLLLREGERIVDKLNLMEINGKLNDLNAYLAEFYKKDFKNLRKLNRLNKKIRVKELKFLKKKKKQMSRNFYLTYFELRKMKRKYDKHQYFDREKVKTSYKEFKI